MISLFVEVSKQVPSGSIWTGLDPIKIGSREFRTEMGSPKTNQSSTSPSRPEKFILKIIFRT